MTWNLITRNSNFQKAKEPLSLVTLSMRQTKIASSFTNLQFFSKNFHVQFLCWAKYFYGSIGEASSILLPLIFSCMYVNLILKMLFLLSTLESFQQFCDGGKHLCTMRKIFVLLCYFWLMYRKWNATNSNFALILAGFAVNLAYVENNGETREPQLQLSGFTSVWTELLCWVSSLSRRYQLRIDHF